MRKKLLSLNIVVLILVLVSCVNQNTKIDTVGEIKKDVVYEHQDWTKNTNIYEVNIRQYTPEGTFKAFEKHMPRLKEMGVGILWLMPIHPISEKNRKGSLGSYYAVQDYQKVNPDFGTLEDLKHLVNYAHELGMKVIIDWVANHTGWDNWLITDHPEYYTKDSLGNMMVPENTDWTDVADLNYENHEMREYMIQSLEYWIKEANIDGYRCDVAGMVPTDFWIDARIRLEAIRPVFMLAEWESHEIHKAFDMSYGWEFHHIMNEIAKGNKGLDEIDAYMAKMDSTYCSNDYIMHFTSNHDENSWNGTVFERMGDAYKAFAVLSATMPGMPLIYSGQEAKLNKRLEFFEKDEIDWTEIELHDFYTKLLSLKKNNTALWNGNYGGSYTRIQTTNDENIIAFVREKENDKILIVLNLSEQHQTFSFKDDNVLGNYISLLQQANVILNNNSNMSFEPWEFKVLIKE